MAYKLREHTCVICGNKFWKRAPEGAKYCSVTCSISAARDANRQMMNKSGPVYEHWRRQVKECAVRYQAGMDAGRARAAAGYRIWADRL